MKTLYRPSSKIEAFYAGGAIALSDDGLHVACAFYDEIKVTRSLKRFQICMCCALLSLRLSSSTPDHKVCLSLVQVVDTATGQVKQTLAGVSIRTSPHLSADITCPPYLHAALLDQVMVTDWLLCRTQSLLQLLRLAARQTRCTVHRGACSFRHGMSHLGCARKLGRWAVLASGPPALVVAPPHLLLLK